MLVLELRQSSFVDGGSPLLEISKSTKNVHELWTFSYLPSFYYIVVSRLSSFQPHLWGTSSSPPQQCQGTYI